MTEGRQSRDARLRNEFPGTWGTSSQDLVGLSKRLFKLSEEYAGKCDGNVSIYALAGIPMLFSALRCLLIELNGGMYDLQVDSQRLEALAASPNEYRFLLDHYDVQVELARHLKLLWEVRNEIVHPAHRPGPEKSGTPAYLTALREAGLLQSTGHETDFIWLSQLQSHRLFIWAFETVAAVVEILHRQHAIQGLPAAGLRASYSVKADDM